MISEEAGSDKQQDKEEQHQKAGLRTTNTPLLTSQHIYIAASQPVPA